MQDCAALFKSCMSTAYTTMLVYDLTSKKRTMSRNRRPSSLDLGSSYSSSNALIPHHVDSVQERNILNDFWKSV